MERQLFILLVTTVSLALTTKNDIYSRNSVHGIKLRRQSDLKVLADLESELDLDIWQDGMPSARDAMVMSTPANEEAFLAALDQEGLEHYLEIGDVAKFLDKQDENLSKWRMARGPRMVFDDFPRYAEILAYMERIAAQYPNKTTLVTAGQSYEGRPIKYLKISTTNFEDRSKPIYFMDAMIHAREWVAAPVTLYTIFRLVEDLKSEEEDLLEDIDWIIMPVVNPDGYEFTHTNERLWRKTRSPIPASDCIGVDANRNFDKAFNTAGVSDNPCALTFPGTNPFSEVEIVYVRDIMHQYLDRIQLYLNIHSHGNYVLFGYGDTSLPANAFHVHQVAAAMGAAMDVVKLPQANFYLVGNSGSVLYRTSGSAQDYGQHIGIPFSYTLELPGYGSQFAPSPEYINHINEETWRGISISAGLSRSYYKARHNVYK